MAEHGVHFSGLSHTIWAGTLNPGHSYFTSKTDATRQACLAVARYVLAVYGDGPEHGLTLTAPDGTGYELTVRCLTPRQEA